MLSAASGVTDLTVDSLLAIAEISETLHLEILETTDPSAGLISRPLGLLTSFIYGSVRLGLWGVGAGVSMALRSVASSQSPTFPSSAPQTSLVAVLNGVVGDHLEKRDNPLALRMEFRTLAGLPLRLALGGAELAATLGSELLSRRNLVIFVHGLCSDDSKWAMKPGADYRASLERDVEGGFVTLSLLYNSGLHVSSNGRAFAVLLEELVNTWPHPIEQLHIVGHSMGGLVARAACHIASEEVGYSWYTTHLRSLCFLGTPHGGSPVERLGNLFHVITECTRFSAPFSRLGKLRSAGITDLRYGSVHASDWATVDRFDNTPRLPLSVPLPTHVRTMSVAATLDSEGAGGIVDKLAMSDGIVPLTSALGEHEETERSLKFGESVTVCGLSHLGLMGDERVVEIVKAWCTGEEAMSKWRERWSFGGPENRVHHLGVSS